MKTKILMIALSFLLAATAHADGTKPVTFGVVLRGLTLTGGGASNTPAQATCDFSKEGTVNGIMTGASVQCGTSDPDSAKRLLPDRFNAYCIIPDAGRLPNAARLIASPIKDNRYHCDLSGITPKQATNLFGGAYWR